MFIDYPYDPTLDHNAEHDHIVLNIGDVVKVFNSTMIRASNGEPMVAIARVVNIFSQYINGDEYKYYVVKCFDEDMNEQYDPNVCDTKYMSIIASSEQLKMIPYIPSQDDIGKDYVGLNEFFEYMNSMK